MYSEGEEGREEGMGERRAISRLSVDPQCSAEVFGTYLLSKPLLGKKKDANFVLV